jgi:hypothetical protein
MCHAAGQAGPRASCDALLRSFFSDDGARAHGCAAARSRERRCGWAVFAVAPRRDADAVSGAAFFCRRSYCRTLDRVAARCTLDICI